MSDVFNESDIVEAGTFGADAYHSIWHRGFHVTLTICQCAQFFSVSIQLFFFAADALKEQFFHSTLLDKKEKMKKERRKRCVPKRKQGK